MILKKGDPKVLDNLRHISILSVIGKILEKINDMFYDLQFSFRSGCSVHDAVYNLLYCL